MQCQGTAKHLFPYALFPYALLADFELQEQEFYLILFHLLFLRRDLVIYISKSLYPCIYNTWI